MTHDHRDIERENARLRSEVERLHDRVQKLEANVETLRQRYERLRRRRVVRIGLAVAGLWAKVKGSDRSPVQEFPPAMETNRTTEEVVAEVLRRRPDIYPESGPMVRVVVLTRNGHDHLERLFNGLESTTRYRSFDVLVVDNDSTDRSHELFQHQWTFPVTVIRNLTNVTFSEGCNQGAANPTTPYLLFLNNDVDPITPDWLGAMVSAAEADNGTVAVGAVLLYPDNGPRPLSVQHGGIGFRHVDGVPLPYNLGGDLESDELLGTWPVPAATAACLLVRSEAFWQVGGFDAGYVYGLEDVDLCLRFQETGGSVVLAGGAVLFHHESATQSQSARGPVQARRRSNRMRFVEQWAPTLSRNIKMEAVSDQIGFWAPHMRRKAAVTLTEDSPRAGWGDWYTAHELGEALEKEGWEVVYAEARSDHWYDIPPDVSMVVSLLDRFDVRRAPQDAVTVAWVRNWTDRWTQQEWFPHYDVVLPSSGISSALVLESGATPPSVVPLATNPTWFYPRGENLSYRCDYTFSGHYWGVGRSLIDNLEVAPGETFTIYGKGWDQVPRVARYWRGHLPYEELPELYSSTKIVLDDTAGPTLPYGAVNARVFDALACGALVISNNEAGSRELFEGLLPTYGNRAELRRLLDKYLADERARSELTERLRQTVIESHTYQQRAGDIPRLAVKVLTAPSIAIKIGPPDHETAESWGDTHFARAFANSLRRLGWRTRIDILPEWDLPDRQGVDVVVHIRGLRTYVPKPGHINALWIISHPDDITPDECDRFDVVFVASELFATELSEKVNVPVHVLWQATDTDRFHPVERNPELASEVLFVGNSRKQKRPMVEAAIAAGLPLTIYGSGWDGLVPSDYVRAEYFPNEHLAELYSSAKVVLNDHWPDMANKGFISNRVFDALACGATVVSDPVEGMETLFPGGPIAQTSIDDLGEVVRSILAEDELPSAPGWSPLKMEALHTFDARAQQFVSFMTFFETITERL